MYLYNLGIIVKWVGCDIIVNRYARKPLVNRKCLEIPVGNTNLLYPQTAWKQKMFRNSCWECEFVMPTNRLKAESAQKSMLRMRICYTRKSLESRKCLAVANIMAAKTLSTYKQCAIYQCDGYHGSGYSRKHFNLKLVLVCDSSWGRSLSIGSSM